MFRPINLNLVHRSRFDRDRGIFLVHRYFGEMSGAVSNRWSCSTLGEGLNEVLAQSYPDGEEEELMKMLEDTLLIILVSCQEFASHIQLNIKQKDHFLILIEI